MTNTLINKSDFNVTVNKIGGRISNIEPITVRNQIREIRSIDDIPNVNSSLKADGSTIFWNSNTGEYQVRPLTNLPLISANVAYITTLYANNSPGSAGQVLLSNGAGIYWGNDAGDITNFSYSSSNNTFTILSGPNSVFSASISTVNNFSVTGNLQFIAIDGGSY